MKQIALALSALALLSAPAYADVVGAAVTPGTAATQSSLGGCIYRTGAITPTNGQQMAVSCDASGNAIVSLSGTSPPAAASQAYQGFADSNVALGGSATFTGTARVMPNWADYFQCRAFSDQTGTLNVLESDDTGGSFRLVGTQAIAASGVAAVVRVTITGVPATTSFQCQVVNGATPETVLRLTSSESTN